MAGLLLLLSPLAISLDAVCSCVGQRTWRLGAASGEWFFCGRAHGAQDDALLVNNKWRLNRYDGDEEFFPHYDSGYEFSLLDRTLVSLVIYLNDDFDGRDTVFFDNDGSSIGGGDHVGFTIHPRAGLA